MISSQKPQSNGRKRRPRYVLLTVVLLLAFLAFIFATMDTALDPACLDAHRNATLCLPSPNHRHSSPETELSSSTVPHLPQGAEPIELTRGERSRTGRSSPSVVPTTPNSNVRGRKGERHSQSKGAGEVATVAMKESVHVKRHRGMKRRPGASLPTFVPCPSVMTEDVRRNLTRIITAWSLRVWPRVVPASPHQGLMKTTQRSGSLQKSRTDLEHRHSSRHAVLKMGNSAHLPLAPSTLEYDRALRCIGGYFTVPRDAGERRDDWVRRAATKAHPFSHPLHGGVSPQRNVAQGAFIAALLGIDDAAEFAAAALTAKGAWLPQRPQGPHDSTKPNDRQDQIHQQTQVTHSQPQRLAPREREEPLEVIVEAGSGMGSMLGLACLPPSPDFPGLAENVSPQGHHEHSRRILKRRCFAADTIDEQIAHGRTFLPHMNFAASLSLAHLPTGSADAALSHGVQSLLTTTEFCSHITELLRVLRPGTGTLVVWMLTPLQLGSRIHPTFFLDGSGVAFSTCRWSMLPELTAETNEGARASNTSTPPSSTPPSAGSTVKPRTPTTTKDAPLDPYCDVELLTDGGGAMYPADYARQGFFGVRIRRTLTPWPRQRFAFDGRAIATTLPPLNRVEKAAIALEKMSTSSEEARDARSLLDRTWREYANAVAEAAQRGVVTKTAVGGQKKKVYSAGTPTVAGFPNATKSWGLRS